MSAKPRMDAPNGLSEEYYQINTDILGSFNKYRPPLNIFRFKEDVARIMPYYKVGERLSNEQVEELAALTEEGLIFVSRADHPVYVKHISYQLDLVLIDKNLKEREIADIFQQALTRRLEEFLDQPVLLVFQKFWADLLVLTEYLWHDPLRIKALTRRLHATYSLARHSFNCGIMGLALYMRMNAKNFEEGGVKRKNFDHLAAGLFLHDMGMTKVAAFIREKEKPLVPDERNKVLQHPMHGSEMLAKLDLKFPEVEACILEHHERLTGTGYPQKRVGAAVTPVGRLCAVVDSYCAMITKRPYAEAMDPMKAATALAQDGGYDPEITKHLQAMILTQKMQA
jgi:HD-GYP domain-containing protein (c-di-GMP phosphodiesterase class II)